MGADGKKKESRGSGYWFSGEEGTSKQQPEIAWARFSRVICSASGHTPDSSLGSVLSISPSLHPPTWLSPRVRVRVVGRISSSFNAQMPLVPFG